MVVEADKVQHAVDDDAVRFALVCPAKSYGVLLNAVHADAKLARQHSLTVGQGKGHDVGIEVVTKALFVDFQQLVITTKLVVQLPYRLAVTLCYCLNPRLRHWRVDEWHIHVQCAESDHYCVFFFK